MKRCKMLDLTKKMHPVMKMTMSHQREGQDRSGMEGMTLQIRIGLLLLSTLEDPMGLN